jgi:hypothetical protein
MNQLDCQVEEAWIREALLRSLYSIQGRSFNLATYGIDASQDMNYQGSTCICRVPKAQVKAGTIVECVHCGESLAQLRTNLTGPFRMQRL